MKLINKAILQYLLVSVPLIMCAIVISYFLIKTELRDGADETLLDEKIKAEQIISKLSPESPIYLSADSIARISITPFHPDTLALSDTLIFNVYEGELIPARLLHSYENIEGRTVHIQLYKSSLEESELLEAITITIALLFIFLMVAFLIVNLLLSNKNWKAFYQTLEQLKQFNFTQPVPPVFEKSNIIEFTELNDALNVLLTKLQSDYKIQKQFIENASHELQTPLAVIKANINLLIQSPQLGAAEMESIQSIENTIQKISSLNRTLLLLSKIENHQFIQKEHVDLSSLIQQLLLRFDSQISSKQLHVIHLFSEKLDKVMNKELAEIMLANLIQNAIRHNKNGGSIHIKNTANTLEITNTGEASPLDKSTMFQRFQKGSSSTDSNGLGLSIVKSIGDISHFDIAYHFNEGSHTFKIVFK